MRVVLILALMLLPPGCQYDPHAHLYTTARPQQAGVVGRYTLVKQTVTSNGLVALDGRLCMVDLRADGTFFADNVPRMVDFPDANVFNTLVSVQGSWRVDSVGSVDGGWSARTRWGIYLDSGTAMLLPAGLTGQKAPYGLIFTLGDPDGGKAMFLERIK